MKEENKIISLAQHIAHKEHIKTFDQSDFEIFPIKKDKILYRRAAALFCDVMVISGIKLILDISYIVFVGNFLLPLSNMQKNVMMNPHMGVHISVFLLIYTTYFLYCNYSLHGKTIGKMWMKLNVVSDNFVFEHAHKDHAPNFREALRRTMGYLFCYMSFGTFFLINFLNEEKRGIPDFLSKTRVVSDEWLKGHHAFKKHEAEVLRININSLSKAA